jgi:hypothetical protein
MILEDEWSMTMKGMRIDDDISFGTSEFDDQTSKIEEAQEAPEL